MVNVAALIWQFLPDLNWAGFYRLVANDEKSELVLGPFQGKAACILPGIEGDLGRAVVEDEGRLTLGPPTGAGFAQLVDFAFPACAQ